MTDAIKKLREPAALAAAAFAALSVLASVIELLFTSGGSFSDNAAGQTGNLLNFSVALALAIAVYLANHIGPALDKARLITLITLVTAAVAAVFGLVSFFAGFGADSSGTDKFSYFLWGAGGAVVLGVSAWYVWLTWQTHAPARPAEPVAPVGGIGVGGQGGWAPPQGQPGQPGPATGQQQQGQQPAGFGWTPGNPNEQTAYLPPQAPPAGPQTLHAQQSSSGSYTVAQQGQPGFGAAPGAQQAPAPGQPGSLGQPPQQPQPGGDHRTQMMPPVPPTMQEYAPDPQPWQPAGPGAGQVPPQQPGAPANPMYPGDGQPVEPDRNDGHQTGPFGVGNWQ
jgi:hypothetical protein